MRSSRTGEDLQAALQADGCPVCRLVGQDEQQWFDMLIYEQVTDRRRRGELRRSRGFCAAHSASFSTREGAPLGAAIIARSLLGVALAEHDEPEDRSRGWLRGLRGRGRVAGMLELLRPQVPCPACLHLRERTQEYLGMLLDLLGTDPFAGAYLGSDGICVPHLRLALARPGVQQAQERLLDAQLQIWRRLAADLDELVRKHDYRYRQEQLTPEERTVWRRAIMLLGGQRQGRDELPL